MSRYKVRVGKRFDIEAVDVVDVNEIAELAKVAESRRRARMQERLAYLILGALVFALLVATAIGFMDGTYDEVNSAWSAAALPLGYVLKAYFDARD